MHAAAIDAKNRLGHEGSIDTVLEGDFLNYQAVGHHTISHGQGIGVSHIYLVLAGGNLVVGVLNTDAHLLQGEHRLSSQVSSGVQRSHIKVASNIHGLGSPGVLKIKILKLRPDIIGVAQVSRSLQVSLQDISGVTIKRLTSWSQDVTEHAGDAVMFLGPPGEQLESIGVR